MNIRDGSEHELENTENEGRDLDAAYGGLCKDTLQAEVPYTVRHGEKGISRAGDGYHWNGH